MRGNYTDTSSYFTVYPYGEIVKLSTYYINWTPSYISTGTFLMHGSTYNFSDYSSGTFLFGGGGFITSSAFKSNTDITTITTNATEIRRDAFRDCTALTSVSLSNCIDIESNAFYSCYSLSYVYAPKLESVTRTCFEYCSSLTSIDLPSCSYIDVVAFGHCLSLSSVSVPLVEYISSQAFYSCPLLTSIDLPSCSVIEYGAFQRCYGLSRVSVPVCESVGSSAFRTCSSLADIELPVCSFIGEQAFSGCVSLSTITVRTSSVCVLSNSNAFYGTGITSSTGDILVPESLYESYVIAPEWSYFFQRIRPIEGFYVRWTPSNITGTFKIESQTYNFADYSGEFRWSTGSIGTWAFSKASFTSMETNARWIGIGAFESCSNLSYANCTAASVVGDGAFRNCSNLRYANLPFCETLTPGIFAYCRDLSSLSVPRVGIVTAYCIFSCWNLRSIVLPRCYVIRDMGFLSTALKSLTLGSTSVCRVYSYSTFYGTDLQSIYVPSSLVTAYKNDSYWYMFSSIIYPINN